MKVPMCVQKLLYKERVQILIGVDQSDYILFMHMLEFSIIFFSNFMKNGFALVLLN